MLDCVGGNGGNICATCDGGSEVERAVVWDVVNLCTLACILKR
jgi:hypothetical protein